MATSTDSVTVAPRRWSTVSPTAGSLGAFVTALTFEVGSVGRASRAEPHPVTSIANATAITTRVAYERLGLILVIGRFSRSCTGTHLLSRFSHGDDGEGGGLRTAGTR